MDSVASMELETRVKGLPSDLGRLAVIANEENTFAQRSAEQAISHAIRSGEALWAARELNGKNGWTAWLETNWKSDRRNAYRNMRLAYHQDRLTPGITKKAAEIEAYSFPSPFERGMSRRYTEEQVFEIKHLHDDGLNYQQIDRKLGLSRGIAQYLAHRDDPRRRKMRDGHSKRQRAKQRRAASALREREQRAAAKQIGGAFAKSYTDIHRLCEVVDVAAKEAQGEGKRHLFEALTDLYAAKDKIIKALA